MAFPIAIPVAISAIKALIKFRGRLDTILSLNATTTGLPFALPPLPADDALFLNDMLRFFGTTDQGKMVLHLRGLEQEFKNVFANPHSIESAIDAQRQKLFKLFYLSTDVRPKLLGPPDYIQANLTKGPSAEMRLAYFVVESQRLSNNSATVRILLTTADTLLEFAGDNASVFIANKQTCSIVKDLIEEFAGKRDFDDDGMEMIFKSLLGSTALAFVNNPGELVNSPALKVFFAALGEVRDDKGNNFVADFVSVEGLEKLIASCAAFAAKDTSFITDNDLMQKSLAAMLTKIGSDFPKIIKDPKAFLGVLEAALSAAAVHAKVLLPAKFKDQPALSAILDSVLQEVAGLAGQDGLFPSIANGQLITDIYKTALQAVAANPVGFGKQSDVNDFISSMISGLAKALSQKELSTLFSNDTLQALASESLTVLSAHAKILTGDNKLATSILAAVFRAGAKTIADGVTKDDLIEVTNAALKAASGNLALLGMNATLTAVLSSLCNAYSNIDLKHLTDSQMRKDLLLASLQAVAVNPQVWSQWEGKKLTQPLVEAVLLGLKTDPTKLLSGSVLVDAIRRILQATARRGGQIINASVQPDDLKNILIKCLDRANQEIGKTIDGESLPVYLERVMASFLANPSAVLTDILDRAIAEL